LQGLARTASGLLAAWVLATSTLLPHAAHAAAPTISSVSPSTNLPTAGGTAITVTGSDFIQSGSRQFVQVSNGGWHTCGIAADNHKAYCWGNNADGELGNGSSGNGNSHGADSATPVAVVADADGVLNSLTFRQVAAGDYHSCGIASNGKAYCWGYNYYGELGNNSTVSRSAIPVAVAADANGELNSLTFQQISVGSEHTCAIASNGQAYCWGSGSNGRLGNNSTGLSRIPVAVSGGLVFQQIAAGGAHTCAIAINGRAFCWGSNGSGQLGNPSVSSSYIPIAVVADAGGALNNLTLQQIVTGNNNHTCAIASNGQAYCWGYNGYGELGNNSVTNSSIPVAVSGSLTLQQIAAGQFHTCAITTSGRAYCWGYNGDAELGNGSNSGPATCTVSSHGYACSTTPVAVIANGALNNLTLTQISAGEGHACAIASNMQAYCWGANDYGQLGNGAGGAGAYSASPAAVFATTVSTFIPAVTVGGVAATDVTVASATKLTFTSPPMPAGTYTLKIDYGTVSASKTGAMTYGTTDLIFKNGFD
jgi:alpha-tubulin suppressor-like RCC1 family protein